MEKTPFSVLDLPPGAGVDAARTRYRELARRHHPDTASGAGKDPATRIMADLNWAMEELERNPARWRADIGSPIGPAGEAATAKRPVTVAPTLVLLNQENGFTAYVTAAAPDVNADDVRLRYASEVIAVERLPSFGGVANFRICLAEGVRELAAPVRERVEVRARGCEPVEVSVAVEAFAASEHEEDDVADKGRSWVAAIASAAARLLRAA